MIVDIVWGWLLNNLMWLILFVANFMLHSTIIIAFCLFLCFILRNRYAIFHVFLLRACLVTVVLCPLFSICFEAPGIHRLPLPLPLSATDDNVSDSPLIVPHAITDVPVKKVPQKTPVPAPMKRGVIHSAEKKPLLMKSVPRAEAPRSVETVVNTVPQKPLSRKSGVSGKWVTIVYASIIFLWSGLSLIFLLKTVLSYLMLLRIRRSACRAKRSYRKKCHEAAAAMGIEAVPVLQSPLVADIFLGGVCHPAIYLPLNGNEETIASKEVFLHELTHYVRHDNIWNLFCSFGKIVLPLQPLMWILARKLRIIGDFICDDFVVSHQRDHHTYAVQMYTIARLYNKSVSHVVSGTGIATGKSTIAVRVKRILDTSVPRKFKLRLRETASTVFLYFCALVISGFSGFRANSIEKLIDGSTPKQPDGFSARLSSRIDFKDNNTRDNASVNTLIPASDIHDIDVRAVLSELSPDSSETHTEGSVPGAELKYEKPDITGRQNMDVNFFAVSDDFDNTPIELGLGSRDNNDMPDDMGFSSSIIDESERLPLISQHVLSEESGNERKPEYVFDAGLLADVASHDPAGDSAGMVAEFGVSNRYASDTQSFVHTFKALDITVPDMYEYGDMSNPKHEQMAEIYRSLRKNMKYPCWSPDGKRIAFNDSDYGVWVVNADGGEPKLVYDNYYRLEYENYSLHFGELKTLGFSPDGSEIAVKRYNIDIGRGTRVIFDTTGQVSVYTIKDPVPVIESINITTGEHRILAEGAITGSWSQSGKYFAYITEDTEAQRKLWLLDLDRNSRKEIECDNPSTVCFAPDDNGVIVTENERENTCRIACIALSDGSMETMLETNNAMVSDVSSDGRWLLYNDGTFDTRGGVIDSRQVLYNTRTGELRDIIPTGKAATAWGRFSPDGRSICLNVKEESGYWKVYTHELQPSELASKDISTEVHESGPLTFSLTGNFPNPFNMSTTIEFSVAEKTESSLIIYNSLGQKVRELLSGGIDAGVHHVVWDGCNESGSTVSAGMYIVRLCAGNDMSTLKMTLMK